MSTFRADAVSEFVRRNNPRKPLGSRPSLPSYANVKLVAVMVFDGIRDIALDLSKKNPCYIDEKIFGGYELQTPRSFLQSDPASFRTAYEYLHRISKEVHAEFVKMEKMIDGFGDDKDEESLNILHEVYFAVLAVKENFQNKTFDTFDDNKRRLEEGDRTVLNTTFKWDPAWSTAIGRIPELFIYAQYDVAGRAWNAVPTASGVRRCFGAAFLSIKRNPYDSRHAIEQSWAHVGSWGKSEDEKDVFFTCRYCKSKMTWTGINTYPTKQKDKDSWKSKAVDSSSLIRTKKVVPTGTQVIEAHLIPVDGNVDCRYICPFRVCPSKTVIRTLPDGDHETKLIIYLTLDALAAHLKAEHP